MFNKFALAFTGLMLTVSSVGCCCLGGYGYGTGYGMRGGCPPCPNACSPMGTAYYSPSQTAYAPAMDMSQTAFAPSNAVYAPTTTALAPIQGQPIYNTAVVPGATLPLY